MILHVSHVLRSHRLTDRGLVRETTYSDIITPELKISLATIVPKGLEAIQASVFETAFSSHDRIPRDLRVRLDHLLRRSLCDRSAPVNSLARRRFTWKSSSGPVVPAATSRQAHES